MAVNEDETGEMKEFFTKLSLDMYWDNVVAEGYSNWSSFINILTENDVEVMIEDIEMTAKGHKRRLMSAWKQLKGEQQPEHREQLQIQNLDVELPENVRELLSPESTSIKYTFYNEVVKELYAAVYDKMDVVSFKKYVCDQRLNRYLWNKDIEVIENIMLKARSSNDGRWSNVRQFSNIDYPLVHKDKHPVEQTIKFIKEEKKRAALIKNKFVGIRDCIIKGINPDYKTNEVQHIGNLISKVTECMSFLDEQKQVIEDKYERVGFIQTISDDAEERRKRRRAKENKSHAAAYTISSLKKSASSVLGLIVIGDITSWINLIADNKFNFSINKSNIHNINKLVPLKHLRGIKFLQEKGVFTKEDGADAIALQAIKDLTKQESETKIKNQEKKKAALEKEIRNSKQRKISFTEPPSTDSVLLE